MTKYEQLYGYTVSHFPNELENVKEKLRLARIKSVVLNDEPYTYENQVKTHEINQAIQWCEKILKDIEET